MTLRDQTKKTFREQLQEKQKIVAETGEQNEVFDFGDVIIAVNDGKQTCYVKVDVAEAHEKGLRNKIVVAESKIDELKTDLENAEKKLSSAEKERDALGEQLTYVTQLTNEYREKLEAIRSLIGEFPFPETICIHEEDSEEETAEEFYEKLDVNYWIKKLEKILSEGSSSELTSFCQEKKNNVDP